MLAYSPLHHLLAADAGEPLVMTSGNLSDEPIAYDDEDALARLGGIADALWSATARSRRAPTTRSSARSTARSASAPLLIRRSRGYAPASVALPFAAPRPVLGCGAELKNTFCLAKGDRAWVGPPHRRPEELRDARVLPAGIDHLERLFAVEPAVVAHDLHPDYLATRYALAREGSRRSRVQHHHAHLAACLAEHGITRPRSARSSTAPGTAPTARSGVARSSPAT